MEMNWLSVLIAAVIPLALGFLYYNPKALGSAWMDSLGFTEEDLKGGNMALTFGLSFVMAIMLSMFLAGWVNSPGQEGAFDTFKHGAFHGAVFGIFAAMPILMTNGLFEKRSFKNIFINVGYWVIAAALMGGVLDAMNHWSNTVAPAVG